MEKKIGDYSDLELAELASQVYSQLIQDQQSLLGINQEIQRRKAWKAREAEKPQDPEIKRAEKPQDPEIKNN
jgi:hypothetical protein